MSSKRVLIIVLAVSVLLLAGSAHALPPDQVASPAGVTIPYPGRLADPAGQPVADGEYDFTFTLYDAETGGNALWSETQKGVAVQAGSFATVLGQVNSIPADLAKGQGWLAVAVRGPGEAGFTSLSPRQRLSSAPATAASASSSSSCVHDHYGEWWAGDAGTGLRVDSTVNNGTGLLGVANFGESAYGVWGSSAGGRGVQGDSGTGVGVAGVSGSGDGVSGTASASNKSGVYGHNTGSGYGVFGRSANGYGGFFVGAENFDLGLGGAVGRINTDPGDPHSLLYLSSNADIILKLDNDSGENSVLRVLNSGGTNVLTCDESGNLWAAGTKSAVVQTATNGQRLLYAVESPEVWFEDVGSASLVEGETAVTFELIFAETVNLEEDYHVFVTALCQEPVLLFVTKKDAQGFTVRGVSLDGQPSSCAFDYRVVAKRLGYEDVRLQSVTEPAAASSEGRGQ
jgi:hypothetical protein